MSAFIINGQSIAIGENKQIVLAVVLTKSRWEKGEEVHKGNYKGSSGGMEGTGMERGIARLKANGLLPLVEGGSVTRTRRSASSSSPTPTQLISPSTMIPITSRRTSKRH